MMTKIATCCYCGTRAALVLEGRVRHELACSRCGAPLSRLKMLPTGHGGGPDRATAPAATPARPAMPRARFEPPARPSRRKKGKSLKRKVLGEVWDLIEDIFD